MRYNRGSLYQVLFHTFYYYWVEKCRSLYRSVRYAGALSNGFLCIMIESNNVTNYYNTAKAYLSLMTSSYVTAYLLLNIYPSVPRLTPCLSVFSTFKKAINHTK